MEKEHIKLIKYDAQICEVSMYGESECLSSLVFSAMISNPKFAEVIITAVDSYESINASPTAHLN